MSPKAFLPLFLLLLVVGSCGPKTTRLDRPREILEAQSASWEDLLNLVNERYAKVESLTVSRFQVRFTGGSIEKGYLKEYPQAKGHLVAALPDSIFMNILNPVTSSAVVTMASAEGRFQIWIPRENKYVMGTTDIQSDDQEPLYSVRPDHLVQALLVEPVPVDEPGTLYFVSEEQDSSRKYYVIEVVQTSGSASRACLQRKIWIERFGLTLAAQQYYDCGRELSSIEYGKPIILGERWVSRRIAVRRPREHYELELELKEEGVRLNQAFKEGIFRVPQPPHAEVVVLESEPAARKAVGDSGDSG